MEEYYLTSVLIYSLFLLIVVAIQLSLIFYYFKQRKKLRTYIDKQESSSRSKEEDSNIELKQRQYGNHILWETSQQMNYNG